MAEVNKRFLRLKSAIVRLIDEEDAFGFAPSPIAPVANRRIGGDRFRFMRDAGKLEAFRQWLRQQIDGIIFDSLDLFGESWLKQYIDRSYQRGMERAWGDFSRATGSRLPDYSGGRDQFLRSSFGRPVSVDRVNLLLSRTFDDLKGVTDQMSTQLTRELADGMIQGLSPREVARNINRKVETIGRKRALTIARSETIRAHAEGALDMLEGLGVEEVGVAVEWSTAEDDRVCPICEALQGVVLKTSEAHGMFPRHPNCRCSPIPANVGEPTEKQIRGRDRIQAAIDRSIARESSGNRNRTSEEQRARSSWAGSDVFVSESRPKGILNRSGTRWYATKNARRRSLKSSAGSRRT